MPYPALKNENYQNLGGINQKASLFMTGANEALALFNFDYQFPGAYNQRPGTERSYGSTQLAGMSSIQSLTEFSRLNGASWEIFNIGNELYSYNGSTALLRHMGVTFGSSSVGFTFIPSTRNLLDMVPFGDRLFVAGSNFDFFKTNGTSAYKFGVPNSFGNLGFLQTTGGGAGWTGWFQYAIAFVNEIGSLGPVSPYLPGDNFVAGKTFPVGVFNIALAGATTLRISLPVPPLYVGGLNNIQDQYGLTSVVIFRGGPYAADPAGSGPSFVGPLFDIGQMSYAAASATFFMDYGSTVGPLIATGSTAAIFDGFTLIPHYINVYHNALFLAGFSTQPSTMYYSRLGEPESIGATASFEVRSNDGDRITGFVNYRNVQVISKRNSLHYLSGFSSDDYALLDISEEYGCISNRAMCVWQDKLWMLDESGIIEYNGARVAKMSNRVETTFQRMNVQAALDVAAMMHVKDRNEIWTVIPIDGSTVNNHLVVYDYLADAFTEWTGPKVASLAIMSRPTQSEVPFYGDYTGSIHYFDTSFMNDSGTAFTCSIFSRFFGDLGFSVTKMFRQLYFDITMRGSGATQVLLSNLYSDMNRTSIVDTTTFAVSGLIPDQNRIQFGVPGKTLAFELHHVAQDSALQFSGFTVEYRYQRNT